MRYLRFTWLTIMAAFAVLTPAVSAADGDESPRTRAEERRALRERERKAREELRRARRAGDQQAIAMAEEELADIERASNSARAQNANLDGEFNALREAQALLAEVNDEQSAKKAARKISSLFGRLPVPVEMSDSDIEQWSIEQNKVSAQMERLRNEPYFESSGLQEAWTNVTDPFSRRRAQRRR